MMLKKEELRDVDGSDSLHPSRSGDVVVVLRPPYQFDAATPGSASRSRSSSASTATCRIWSTSRTTSTCTPPFVAAGPGHPQAEDRSRACARSTSRRRSPSCWASPARRTPAAGSCTSCRRSPGKYKEITILDISDFHGQLVPLSRGGRQPGRSAAGEPDLRDRWRGVPQAVVRRVPRRSADGSITIAAATPSARRRRSRLLRRHADASRS